MPYTSINFNKKNILITGGAGFIGSNLAFYFQDNFPEANIVVFDCFRSEARFSNGNLKSLGDFNNLVGFKGNVICGNINSKDDLSLLNSYKFDFIFHQAAVSDTLVFDQEYIIKTNVNSFYDILDVAKKHDSVLVYASSAATYGNNPSPQTVGFENPLNPYGYSKYSMDQIAMKFMVNNPKIRLIGLRYFNVYGPREFYKGSTSSMVMQLGHQILKGKSPRLFTNSKNIFRDFIYIDDVIQANIKASEASKNDIYNVGTGNPRSFQDISDILQNELGTNYETDYFINPHNSYQSHTQADIQSTRKYLNFNPIISLEEGIKKYIPEITRLYKNYEKLN
jgi:ADP-L-glycero-D-manno-heptose 6-epimerase